MPSENALWLCQTYLQPSLSTNGFKSLKVLIRKIASVYIPDINHKPAGSRKNASLWNFYRVKLHPVKNQVQTLRL